MFLISIRAKLSGPSIPIQVETEQYLLRTAQTQAEFRELSRLRYQIFYREMAGYRLPLGIDIDRFDRNCDHLVVVDKASQKIVGTYRMRSSHRTKEFYSQTEFKMEEFLQTPEPKIELSRACVHPQHRNGSVMQLLWKGIGQYLQLTQSRYLFGMASVPFEQKTKPNSKPLIAEQRILEHFQITPKRRFQMTTDEQEHVQSSITPPLLFQYLRAGARVVYPPAIDRKLKCYDLLTVLDTHQMDQRFQQKFFS